MNSAGVNIRCVVPSLQAVFNWSLTSPFSAISKRLLDWVDQDIHWPDCSRKAVPLDFRQATIHFNRGYKLKYLGKIIMKFFITALCLVTLSCRTSDSMNESSAKSAVVTSGNSASTFYLSSDKNNVCMTTCVFSEEETSLNSSCSYPGSTPIVQFKNSIADANVTPEAAANWEQFIESIEAEGVIEHSFDEHPYLKTFAEKQIESRDYNDRCAPEWTEASESPSTESMSLTQTQQNCLLYVGSSSFNPDNSGSFYYKNMWIRTGMTVRSSGRYIETAPYFYKIKNAYLDPQPLRVTLQNRSPSGRPLEGTTTVQLLGHNVWVWHASTDVSRESSILNQTYGKTLNCPESGHKVLLKLLPEGETEYVDL